MANSGNRNQANLFSLILILKEEFFDEVMKSFLIVKIVN